MAEDDTNNTDTDRYYEGIGRRKTSTARVRIYTASPEESAAEEKGFLVNDAPHKEYFQNIAKLVDMVEAPLTLLNSLDRFRVSVHVNGGGMSGQAGAIRHGLARALELYDENFRKKLKRAGFLTRDPRMKERKKAGLKKARKAPQFSKR